MSSFEELKNCVTQNDAISFLFCYLTLIKNNESLELPTTKTQTKLQMQWQDILPTYCNHGTKQFYKDLSSLWLSIVKKASEKNKSATTTELSIKDLLSQLKNSTEGGVNVSMSEHYALETISFDEKNNIINSIKEALAHSDINLFLEHYCHLCLTDQQYILPKSTTIENLTLEWKKIIQVYFPQNTIDLVGLGKRWFNLIHSYGVPNSNTILFSLYKILKEKNNS
jgi:hypothetical protein